MSPLSNLSIHTKLTLMTAIAMALALLVACVFLLYDDIRRTRASNIKQLESLGAVLATNSTAAISFGQSEAAEELLNSLQSRPTIQAACMIDNDSNLFAWYTREGSDFIFDFASYRPGYRYTRDGHLEVVVPIEDMGEPLGLVFLRESTAQLQETMEAHLKVSFLVLLVAMAFGVGISLPLQRTISDPVLELADTAQRISGSGDYSVRVSRSSEDEIGSLYREFNAMLDRIQMHEKEIKKTHDELHSLNLDLEERVLSRTTQLEQANAALQSEMREKDRATEELQQMQAKLMETSRKAGMADIANGVLHNVGNVLNSLNVSANLIRDRVRESKVPNIRKCVDLIEENSDDLGTFFENSDKGRVLPNYLSKLAKTIESDQKTILEEMESLATDVEHIKDIVRAQQSHAGAFGVVQRLEVVPMFEEALRFVADSIVRHEIELVRDYQWQGEVEIEKSKLIQILVNLIKNAKESILDHDAAEQKIMLTIREDDDNAFLEVSDTGHGIAKENLTTIFSQGFTTKEEGHGFGLHASANAAKEMGGDLSASSEGIGHGAKFTLRIPKAGPRPAPLPGSSVTRITMPQASDRP